MPGEIRARLRRTMLPVLELRAVTKEFPGCKAVDEVTLAIEPGSLFSLVGPSGCGKTTLLRLVAGFEEPSAGEIRLNGQFITELPPYERNVSTVFQSYALFPHLTARQNIEFGLKRRPKPAPAADVERRVRAMLALVQIEGKESRRPDELSGGERQRVALARSLVIEPELLLLDEPLAALDPNLRRQVRAELRDLQKRSGVSFLMVTHDREEALSVSDTIAVMNRGRIEQTGTPQELYSRPRTRFAAEFLGAVNWIDGVGVRPEAIRLDGEGREATVESVEFLGGWVQVALRMKSGQQVLVQEPARPRRPGESAFVSWKPEDEIRVSE